MYNNDPKTLNAGAYANLPQQDIRLSGDHHPTNTQQDSGIMAAAPQTYTQRRRAQMAGGGIMGSNNGSMLVAPTADGSRPGYGWLSDIKDKFVDDIIPNEIKNPLGIAALTAASTKLPIPGVEGWLGDLLESAEDIPYIGPVAKGLGRAGEVISDIGGAIGTGVGNIYEGVTGNEFDISDLWTGTKADPSLLRQAANVGVPMAIGKEAYDYQKDYLARQPKFAEDTTGINFQTAQQAMDDPNLRFKPQAQYANVAEGGRIGYSEGGDDVEWRKIYNKYKAKQIALGQEFADFDEFVDQHRVNEAQGGRIGYNRGRVVNPGGYAGDVEIPEQFLEDFKRKKYEDIMNELERWKNFQKRQRDFGPGGQEVAQGGRIGAQEGGLMNLGGMEKDYRQEGGFVPLGGEEKADDVPARLSKNEFVFTADAVRAAGGGDIDQGAEVMENVMKNLESGGEVSEDSQGLEGARGMFANAQELQKRIV